MFDLDKWQEILHVIKQNKLRTFLTAFGVFWGILMLILLLGVGRGMQNGTEGMFTSDVQDSIWIFPRKTSVAYKGLAPGRQLQFTEDDIEALRRELPGLNYAAAENPLGSIWTGDIIITYGKKTGSFAVYGVGDEYFNIKLLDEDFRYGRNLNKYDHAESRKVVVIGTRVAEALFLPGTDPSGEYITINGVSFRVVGVFYDSGWQGRMSERLYIPLSTYKQTFDKSKKVHLIAIAPKPGVDGFKLEQAATDLLKSRHWVAPDDRRALRSNNLAERARSFRSMFAAMDIFIWFVGIGTLMAGIVGISNIMIITVKDRTKEIGVRKALGATPGSIIGLILLESVALTATAGYLGLVLGVGLLEGVQYLMQRMNMQAAYFSNPEVGFGTAVAATLLLVFVGAAAGLLPAMKAARVTPIEAMRADD